MSIKAVVYDNLICRRDTQISLRLQQILRMLLDMFDERRENTTGATSSFFFRQQYVLFLFVQIPFLIQTFSVMMMFYSSVISACLAQIYWNWQSLQTLRGRFVPLSTPNPDLPAL